MPAKPVSTGTPGELRTIAAALRKLSCALDCSGDLADELPLAIAGIKPFPKPFPPLPTMEAEARALLLRAGELGAFGDAGVIAIRAHFNAANPLRLSYLWLAANGGSDTLLHAQEGLIAEAQREWERTGPPFSRINEIPEYVAARALAMLMENLAGELERDRVPATPGADPNEQRDASAAPAPEASDTPQTEEVIRYSDIFKDDGRPRWGFTDDELDRRRAERIAAQDRADREARHRELILSVAAERNLIQGYADGKLDFEALEELVGNLPIPAGARASDAKTLAPLSRGCDEPVDDVRAELNELSDLQRDIIQALDELHAYDRATRQTTEQVAKKARGSAKVGPLRKPTADLTMRQVTESVGGREGGVWLSAKGRRAAEILRGGDGSTGEAPAS